jgi:hypothetical protein
MTFTSNPKLAPIYEFFEKSGTERLQGLNPNYFLGLNESEKEEAWSFLSERFARSVERIEALYNLDPKRAVDTFKKAIDVLVEPSAYASERKALEECRLLMLHLINNLEPDEKYIAEINRFAGSEFKEIRAQFTRSVPTHQVTRDTVDALKGMIFTETDDTTQSTAIIKLMAIYGMNFDAKDPLYKSTYMSLRSDDHKQKLSAIKRLEAKQPPDYV